MTKEVKVVYTDAVVEDMKTAYTAADSDEARAAVVKEFKDKLGVSERSVIAKLVSMRVYKAKVRKAKDGSEVETKSKIVADIAKAIGVQEEVMDSLEKATKPVLKMLREAVS